MILDPRFGAKIAENLESSETRPRFSTDRKTYATGENASKSAGFERYRRRCVERGPLRNSDCISIRMLDFLLGERGCPKVLPFFPNRATGRLKIRVGERPHSYRGQLRSLRGDPENRSPAFRTKIECHSPTAIPLTRILLDDALRGLDLLALVKGLDTESASRPSLTFEAVAHGDENGIASNR
jgi:hypothetical protein